MVDEVVGFCDRVEFAVEGGDGGNIGAFEIEFEVGVGVSADHFIDEVVDGVVTTAFGAGRAEQVINAFVVDAKECGGLERLVRVADAEGEAMAFLDTGGAEGGDRLIVCRGIEIIFFSVGSAVGGDDGFHGDAGFRE